MDEQGYRFGVGVLVVASLVIAVMLILFFGAAPNFFAERYEVTIRFDAAPNVASDTPVRKNGVQIGRVKSVQLLDEDGVDLTLELDGKYKIRAGELPQIGSGSIITGDAVVEFIPPTPSSLLTRFDGTGGSPEDGMLDENEMSLASTPIRDGDFYRGGRVAPDPMDALLNMQESVGTTFVAIERASNQITAVALDVQQLLNGGDGAMRNVSDKLEMTIDNFNSTLDSIEALFNDPSLQASLDTLANRLPTLMNEAEAVMKQTGNTLAAFEGVGRAAEETVLNVTETVKNVRDFTEPLGENSERLVSDALRTLDNLNALMIDLRKVAARVNQGDGTLAKLIEDDQLYYTLINTLENVETITRKLEPIVEDARVFTDKVARQPSSIIDLRGAFTGRPSGAGVK